MPYEGNFELIGVVNSGRAARSLRKRREPGETPHLKHEREAMTYKTCDTCHRDYVRDDSPDSRECTSCYDRRTSGRKVLADLETLREKMTSEYSICDRVAVYDLLKITREMATLLANHLTR